MVPIGKSLSIRRAVKRDSVIDDGELMERIPTFPRPARRERTSFCEAIGGSPRQTKPGQYVIKKRLDSS